MEKKKLNTIIILSIISLVVLSLFYFSVFHNNPCEWSENQMRIVNSDIPTNAEDRKELMRELESTMNFKDYACFDNPRTLLIKRFGKVPLEK